MDSKSSGFEIGTLMIAFHVIRYVNTLAFTKILFHIIFIVTLDIPMLVLLIRDPKAAIDSKA